MKNLMATLRRTAAPEEGPSLDDIERREAFPEPPPEVVFQAPAPKAALNGHAPLPHSLEAEKGVLGSIMAAAMRGPELARKSMYFAEGKVSKGHFHHPAHAEVWAAMQQLHRDNEPLNFVSITESLRATESLDRVGGMDYVTDLGDFVPTDANLDYYLGVLQEKKGLRDLRLLADKLAEQARDPAASPGALLEIAQEALKRIATSQKVGVLPDLDDMTDLTGENLPPPPPELVAGILHKGSKLIIGGTSKGRKTFSLMDLAISVATGTPWWGFPTIKGKVCYINFEIQRPFFARRFQDICRVKATKVEKGMFHCWTLRGYVEGIEKMSAEITKILLQEDYVLIIFDPIYKALGDRDENKAGDVASMLNELEAIAVKTGAAIAFGAHYSKGNQAAKDAMDRIGGSGVFARDPDAILTMTPHEEEEAFVVDCSLRNFAPQSPFVVRWDWPMFTRDEALNPEALKKPKQVGKTRAEDGQFQTKYKVDHILDCLKETTNGRTPSELLKLVMEQTGMGKSKFWMLWDEAKASPYVIQKERRFFHVSAFTKQP
jgi:RecA-family ATPase